ncbi:hypothetical protein DFH08DRAFT_970864 [Mycena albidolilacea]|uniref:Uncharacterized protein n=1 Tax=Mycena albidolilacea TaxID=1033008 RepID=A0AAD7EEZ0_9AGAR|nr:hypothetical protein DFH08DRAFT_970864 [Mycena albidolilacea]
MTTRPPWISSRSSSSQNERRSLWPNLVVTIPDAFSRYSGFKYRLWFIWYVWHLWSESWRSPPWSAIICGSDGNGDLWLWEDEDEEYIKVFTENIPVFPELLDWHTACWYLKERLGRTTVAATPLAHLTPQSRLRFVAWLLVAGPLRKKTILQNKRIPSITTMIRRWSKAIALPLIGETCDVCGVSGVLPVWIETMLEDNAEFLKHHWKEIHRSSTSFTSSLSLSGLSFTGWFTAPGRTIDSEPNV